MSCTCESVRLLTGLDGCVTITRPSHATGVKVRPASCGLPLAPRAAPARSAVPVRTASRPEAVLNVCSSMRPWPAFCQACATSVTTPCATVTSPRQISELLALGADFPWADLPLELCVLASTGVVATRQAPIRATGSRRTRRTDMMMSYLGRRAWGYDRA